MSDNRFLKTNELKSVLSRIKTRVESGIADAISGSTFSLNSLITDGDTLTLNSAKSYIDGIKTTLDTTIASNLATAKGYTDGAKTAIETNISNHISDTSNPHSVTYTQTGAAAASHTHLVSDITDASTELASKTHTHTVSDITDANTVAAAVHSHTLSNITDVTATAAELNTLSGITATTSEINSINKILNFILPFIQRNHSYSEGDRVIIPNNQNNLTIYFECVCDGTTSSSNDIINLYNNVGYEYDSESDEIVLSPTRNVMDEFGNIYNETYELNLDFNILNDSLTIGYYYLDGTVVWRACNLLNSHEVGEIIYKYTPNLDENEYLHLVNGTNIFGQTMINQARVNFSLIGLRILKKLLKSNILLEQMCYYYENRSWGSALNADYCLSFSSFIEFYLGLRYTTDSNYSQYVTGISNDTINFLNNLDSTSWIRERSEVFHFVFYSLLKKMINKPYEFLSLIDSDSNEANDIFEDFAYFKDLKPDYSSMTNNEILLYINSFIDVYRANRKSNMSVPSIRFNTTSLGGKFLKIGPLYNLGKLNKAGLPEIIGAWPYTRSYQDSTTDPAQDGAGYFKETKGNKMSVSNATNAGWGELMFKASRANSIYGNSTTVTPENISVLAYMKL